MQRIEKKHLKLLSKIIKSIKINVDAIISVFIFRKINDSFSGDK